MYKYLLSFRYLRSRYIALASIVSVTLGVATMIVVNSVMSGFQHEMYKRLHGILSDLVVEAHSADGIPDNDVLQAEIKEVLGDDLVGMTTTVHIPAMLGIQVRDQWIQRQVNLIGIDSESYAQVGDFSQYLMNEKNREQLSFHLRNAGYASRLGQVGWDYRKMKVAAEKEMQRQRQIYEEARTTSEPQEIAFDDKNDGDSTLVTALDINANLDTTLANDDPQMDESADLLADDSELEIENPEAFDSSGEQESLNSDEPALVLEDEMDFDTKRASDVFEGVIEEEPAVEFDAAQDTWTGIVLGISISNIRYRSPDGEVLDHFYCKPGDDITATFATAGSKPTAVNANFTVVDFYESKMSEYDSTFAFVPIRKLQELRHMIDPETGTGSVSSIQIKLREGADLNAACEMLRSRFPAAVFPYRIQTWKELQGPLLSAVQMETTILNILLFLIIAVAGFGILATFFMIVVEKTKDIGILKSLGASRGGIMSIFVSYGFSLGCVGAGVGMVLGLLFVVNINTIAVWLESITGREVFDPTIYYFQEIPTIINPFTVTWICFGAMLIAVFASVLPALRAARMHPVEALRYE